MNELKNRLLVDHASKIAPMPDLVKLISFDPQNEAKVDESWKEMQNIRVILRFRPPNSVEQESKMEDIPLEITGNTVNLTLLNNKNVSYGSETAMKESKSTFASTVDGIFDQTIGQKHVFEQTGKPLIEAALAGFNSTLFAYGQTGSGKTYSTFGANDDGSGTNMAAMGIIPRSFVYIFERLEQKCSNGSIVSFSVNIQLLQIYNKQLLDLLNPSSDNSSNLTIKTDFGKNGKENGVYVEGLTSLDISSAREALAAIIEASTNRIVASHKLNATSSRSHMLVLMKIRQFKSDGSSINSCVNFGDLAGSESISKAHGKSDKGKNAEEKKLADERRKEGIEINSSLSALTRTINALVKGKYPGYRDSPLTYLLKDSLGGNSKTTLLVCASPHIYNRSETVRTLRFAATAKDVKNKAHINQTLSVKALKAKIKELEAENKRLKKKLKKKGGNKRKGGFMKELGRRISLYPAQKRGNEYVNGGAVDGNNQNGNREKKKVKKKKKAKKKINVDANGVVVGVDYDESEEEEYEDESEEVIEQENKSCWQYLYGGLCGGADDNEQIEEDLGLNVEYELLNDSVNPLFRDANAVNV